MTTTRSAHFVRGIFLAVLLLALPSAAQGEGGPIQALVPTDFGEVTDIVARMEAEGWVVTAVPSLGVLGAAPDTNPFTEYDVVWVSAQSDFRQLHYLVGTGGHLDAFAQQGGVVFVVDISPDVAWLDVAPGGPEAEALLPEEAETVIITKPDHALITGEGIDGVALTAMDLDSGSGQSTRLANLPVDARETVIAENAMGAVLLEYRFGAGRVLLSGLPNSTDNYKNNLVLYAQSLVP